MGRLSDYINGSGSGIKFSVDEGAIELNVKNIEGMMTDNPELRKKLQDAIREDVRKTRQTVVRNMASVFKNGDPAQARRAVRQVIYEQILGANLNIYNMRRGTANWRVRQVDRKGTSDPKGRGGNRRPRSQRTIDLMSYQGVDRGFILRFLNQGTTNRNITHLTEIKRADGTSKFRFTSNGGKYGNRGSIAARNWFGNASQAELERQASNIDAMIDNILQGILY